MRSAVAVWPLAAAFSLMSGMAFGQPADSVGSAAVLPHASVPILRAAPLVGSVRLDGRLDDEAWRVAAPADRFTQREPKEGEPGTERTEVRVLISEDALYIGARLFDSEPSKIRSRLVRRDEVNSSSDSDFLAVLLDPYHDHSTGVVLRVGPSGSYDDATIAASGNQDTSWDPVWHAHTSIDSLGWTVEMEIPLSQLHYSGSADAVWGIQLRRWINRKQELTEFSFTPLKEESGVSRFGHLTGLGHLGSPRHVELLPYGRVRSEYTQVSDGNPFRDGKDQFPAAGVDVKYGVTSNLTLNATVNPDFGEVEVDPAVVNLSAFETFYPERRPFFVEGADVFRFGESRSYNNFNSTIPFHARRIGRPPQRSLEDSGYVYFDSPARTTITTAAKLTGKTSNGWTMGVLDAVTPVERASYVDTSGAEHQTPVEPLTNYFVGRLRRDYRQGNTVVGALVTTVNRDLEDPALNSLLRSSAYVGGLDLNHYWGGRRWSLDAMLLGSTVNGDEEVIAATQRSSARYFQRPDAKTLHYDPTRTSLSGYSGMLSVNKVAGKHGLGSLTYQDWSPGFEINDVGFQNAADSRALSWLAMYKESKPAKLIRNWDAFVFSNWSWNYDGDNTYAEYAAVIEGQGANYWYGSLRGEYYPGNFDDRLTRGGPLSRIPSGGTIRVNLDSDSRKIYTLGLRGVESWDEAGGHLAQLNASLSVRPTSALRLLFEPGIRDLHDNAQYVQTVDDSFATATYAARYVFGSLHQTQLSLDTRLDWTFSPTLSLQLYLQPLIVSGGYQNIKELRAPGTYEFDVYGGHKGTIGPDPSGGYTVDPDAGGPAPSFHVDNPDFNFRSLRGNAVLRWEYRPGSALFLVWQQSREETEPYGDFDLSRDWHGLFNIEPNNVIALKATYWLPL
jgi:uncharacterized protein DUF5916